MVMFRLKFSRSKERLTKAVGYVDLPTACIRANQTGFFGLSQRVAPESFDGKDTNIDPRQCFFGGRRIDLAVVAQRAEDFATRSTKSSSDTIDNRTSSDSGDGDKD